MAVRRLMKELSDLERRAPDGILVRASEQDVCSLMAWLQGPVDTPYAAAGGRFQLELLVGPDYPQAPPKCRFVTKIFHPNVNDAGDICVNTLKKDWCSDFGILHVLTTIKCLLIYPNPESALDEEAGRLLLERYEDYAKHARLFTRIHANFARSEDGDQTMEVVAQSDSQETATSKNRSMSTQSLDPNTQVPLRSIANSSESFNRRRGVRRL